MAYAITLEEPCEECESILGLCEFEENNEEHVPVYTVIHRCANCDVVIHESVEEAKTDDKSSKAKPPVCKLCNRQFGVKAMVGALRAGTWVPA